MEETKIYFTTSDLESAKVIYKIEVEGEEKSVFKYGEKVIKRGSTVTQAEADAMMFVRENTSIPIPRVWNSYPGKEGYYYIVMDYVDGTTLEECWPTLDASSKQSIASQLRAQMDELRSLPPPSPPYIGGFGGTPCHDQRRNAANGGPFSSEEAFNAWLLSRVPPSFPRYIHKYLAEQLALQTVEKKHEIVFTHRDFHPRNIMVKDGEVVAWLDWQWAGWFPSHWEFLKALVDPMWKTDWSDYLITILDEYRDEYIFDKYLENFIM